MKSRLIQLFDSLLGEFPNDFVIRGDDSTVEDINVGSDSKDCLFQIALPQEDVFGLSLVLYLECCTFEGSLARSSSVCLLSFCEPERFTIDLLIQFSCSSVFPVEDSYCFTRSSCLYRIEDTRCVALFSPDFLFRGLRAILRVECSSVTLLLVVPASIWVDTTTAVVRLCENNSRCFRTEDRRSIVKKDNDNLAKGNSSVALIFPFCFCT